MKRIESIYFIPLMEGGKAVMTESEIKEVVQMTVEEVIKQIPIDFEKVDYLVGVLNGSISLVKHHDDIVTGKKTLYRKKVEDAVIKEDYEKGLSCKAMALKYGMTTDGIYKRLKVLGISSSRKSESIT